MFETTLRYKNPNNKGPVEQQTHHYDSLLVQGHMLAYAGNAIPITIRNLIDDAGLDYYIDPMISDFRSGSGFRDGDDLRGWHAKYVETLGDPLQRLLNDNPNVDARYIADLDLDRISASVVRFQEGFVPEQVEENAGKYVQIDSDSLKPKAVIPWTHKIRQESDIDINRWIIDHSQHVADLSLKPCLYVTQGFIQNPGNRAKLVNLLTEFDISECFLWIDDLDKHETGEPVYKHVIDLVYDISQSNIDPHFYYGDYFSNVLSYFGLTGTAHGTVYSEEESDENDQSGGGGGVQPRYYVEPLRDFLKVQAVVELMQAMDAEMCDCEYCSRHFDEWSDLLERHQSDDDSEPLQPILQKHAVAMKWRNTRFVENHNLKTVFEDLDQRYREFSSEYRQANQISPRKSPDYMQRWKSAAQERREDLL